MTTDLDQIVRPSCARLRREADDARLPVYLVMDNRVTHNRPEHLQLMASLLVHAVWLPSHSTYCFQPVDLTLFGACKRPYLGARASSTRPTLEGTLLGALYLWHDTNCAGTIFNARTAAGIVMLPIKDQPFDFALIMSQVKKTLCENCHRRETAHPTLPGKF
jgi:hypothetical protein